jgi:hypothetical protein
MDNTKANRAADALLDVEYPFLINIGCQAHGLSLLLKDMVKDSSGLVGKTFERTATRVNSFNDGEKRRALIHTKQEQIYGKVDIQPWLSCALRSPFMACILCCNTQQKRQNWHARDD